MKALFLQFFLDLLLKLRASLILAKVWSNLIDWIETDTTSFSNYISRSEIKLIHLSIMFDLRYPLSNLLLDNLIIFFSLYLQPLPPTHRCRQRCHLRLLPQLFDLFLQSIRVYHLLCRSTCALPDWCEEVTQCESSIIHLRIKLMIWFILLSFIVVTF